jgi:predicted cation transporter
MTGVDFAPLLNSAIELASSVLILVISGVLTRYAQKLHVDRNSELMKVVENAITNGIGFAANKVKEATGKKLDTVSLGSPVLEEAVNYVVTSVPTALGKLGITDEKLAEIILSRMVGRSDIPTTHDATPVTGQ